MPPPLPPLPVMGSLARTITCINWFPVRINEYGKVIKTCAVNFPKDNIAQSGFKVIHYVSESIWRPFDCPHL